MSYSFQHNRENVSSLRSESTMNTIGLSRIPSHQGQPIKATDATIARRGLARNAPQNGQVRPAAIRPTTYRIQRPNLNPQENEANPRPTLRHPEMPEHDQKPSAPTTRITQPTSLYELDQNNPLYVPEYEEDIMNTWRETERTYRVNPLFMEKQTHITPNHREVLVNWLFDVRARFQLKNDTMFLTVSIMDRFLQYRSVTCSKLQLLGCSAMFIASKYEETYAPELNDFVLICDRNYSRDQIVVMEKIILTALDFKITVPYAHHFAERYIRALGVDVKRSRLYHIVLFIIQSTLQHLTFVKYLPSLVAITAVSLGLFFTNQPNIYPSRLRKASGYEWQELAEPLREIWSTISNMNNAYKLQFEAQSQGERPRRLLDSVYRFYSDPSQGSVTKKIIPYDERAWEQFFKRSA